MREALASRLRRLRDLMAFAAVGTVAFVVQMVVFDGLGRSGIGPLTANAIAVVLATAVAFVGNRYWVFAYRRGAFVREALSFAGVNAATFALSEAVLALAYPMGAEHNRLATDALAVIGIVVASAIRFLAYRNTVFRRAPAPPATAAAVREGQATAAIAHAAVPELSGAIPR